MGGRRKNGSGTVRLRSDGRWEGRIIISYDDNGKPKYKSAFGITKTECTEKLRAMQEQAVQITGKLTTSAKSTMPFGEWIDLWYQNYSKPSLRETTQAGYESKIYNHIIPQLGNIQLNKLTSSDLQQFYAWLKKSGRKRFTDQFGTGLSDKMIRSCHTICRMSLEKAVSGGLIYRNPAVGCKLPPKKSREMQILTPDEMQRFMTQAKYDGYYEIFLLDIATGMRRGELLALQWDDLDFKTGEMKIQRQVCRVRGELKTSIPKTKGSVRTIILPPSILKILAEYKKTIDSRWIFPSPVKEDSPRDPKSMYSKMQLVLERAGCKRVRFHDLRHTFATMALEHGMDIKTLSAMLGHVSAATTLDVYSHITTDMQRNAAAKIDQGIGGCEPRKELSESTTDNRQQNMPKAKFEPYKGKIRKPGTGCLYQINDHLWEGSYTPTHANGKRKKHTVYAKTKDECEALLTDLIEKIKAAIKDEKEQLNLTM